MVTDVRGRELRSACCWQHGAPYVTSAASPWAARRLHPGSPCQDARTGAGHLMLDTDSRTRGAPRLGTGRQKYAARPSATSTRCDVARRASSPPAKTGNTVVVVVSAMGTTDELSTRAARHDHFGRPRPRDGRPCCPPVRRISWPCSPWPSPSSARPGAPTGAQAGVTCKLKYGKASSSACCPSAWPLHQTGSQCYRPRLQGINEVEDTTTTLGRGGSEHDCGRPGAAPGWWCPRPLMP